MSDQEMASLGMVIDASINEIYMFDLTTLKFVRVNQGARDNLGFSMDELREMTPLSFKPEFTKAQFQALIAPLITGEKKIIVFTTVHKRKDGSLYPVEVHLQRSLLGKRDIFLAVILDITNRTEIQAALDQAQNFLELAPDATLIVNAHGIIQYASAQTVNLLGYAAHELLGENIDTLVPEKFRDNHAKHREAFRTRPKTRLMGDGDILYARAKDGRGIPVEVSLNPIPVADGLLISASLRDISERIRADQAVRDARDAAEAATLAKSRFLASASHDLRQPVQSLNLYLSSLMTMLDAPKALEIGGKMASSLASMKELLDTLLDISKLESGSIEPEICGFKIQTVLDTVMADFLPIAEKKNLVLRCDAVDFNVFSDPALLTRILENFVSNALRYTDSGTVRISCEEKDDALRISVEDTGIGIPGNALGDVFDEYFQVANDHREQGQGLGLGLSVVNYLSKLLGHKVDVRSTVEKGSTFTVTVPLFQGASLTEKPSTEIPSFEKPEGEKMPAILCVDDNPAVLDSLSLFLDVIGYDLTLANTGDEALDHIEKGFRPDVILSDYRLPGYNGIELIKRIRRGLSEDIPVIMMTGDTSSAEIKKSNLSHLEVLSKPVDTNQLTSLISAMIQ